MEGEEVQRRLLRSHGLRVGAEMEKYLQNRLLAGAEKTIPVMGIDARTGVARRIQVDPQIFTRADGGMAS